MTSMSNNLQQQSMEFKFKIGLKDASTFLKQFKEEKLNEAENEQQALHEKTFEEQQMSLSKNQHDPSPQKMPSPPIISHQPIKVSQMLVLNHLKTTLSLYMQDLSQLHQNRDHLVEAIEQLSGKIQGIADLHTKNQNLQLDNYRQRKDIQQLIKEYHTLKLQLILRRNKSAVMINKKKEKLKKLLELMELRVQDRVHVESWQNYYHQLEMNRWNVEDIDLKNNGAYNQAVQQKLIDEILQRKKESKEEIRISKKDSKVEPKDRKDLLGDLKSFSKNFKMP